VQCENPRHRRRFWGPRASQPQHERGDRCKGMAVDLAQVDCPARAAARAEHVEPRRPRHQRGSDRRRPQHVPAGDKLLIPAFDDGLRFGARGSIATCRLAAMAMSKCAATERSCAYSPAAAMTVRLACGRGIACWPKGASLLRFLQRRPHVGADGSVRAHRLRPQEAPARHPGDPSTIPRAPRHSSSVNSPHFGLTMFRMLGG
jgi:hypothetical protein